MNIKDLVKAIAPTAATLLGGPLAGMAVKAIGDAIGMDDATEEKIGAALTGGQLSGEQIVAMKQADNALKVRMAELGIRADELVVEDRKSAREMLAATNARTPAVLSWIVVLGNFVCYAYLFHYGNPTGLDDVLLGRILGTLDTAFGVVLAFWLGTSYSSRSKDATLAQIAKGQ